MVLVLDVVVFAWPTMGLSIYDTLMSLIDDHGHASGASQDNNVQNNDVKLAQRDGAGLCRTKGTKRGG